MTIGVATKFPPKVQQTIVDYFSVKYNQFPMAVVRDRLEQIDRALQLESKVRRSKIESYYDDVQFAVAKTPVNTLANFLIDTFVSGPLIFEVVTKEPDKQEAARQMNAIMEENAKATDWNSQILLYLRDLPKYNTAAIECFWEKEMMLNVSTDVENGPTATGAAVSQVQREGNRLKHWNMYNTFYDTNIPINQVTKHGEYIGTTERLGMIQLQQLISNLKIGNQDNVVMNEDIIWKRGGTGEGANTRKYYIPNVAPTIQKEDQRDNGWLDFFGPYPMFKDDMAYDTVKYHYEVSTIYCRIIPKMFGMTNSQAPGNTSIQIWKFIIVNGDTLLYAEKQTNAHNLFPVVLTQPEDEGIGSQTKSTAEEVIPIQNLVSKIYDSRLAGLNRALDDRAIYDSTRINPAHLNSNDPSAKIPVKPNILNPGIAGAYQSIPYSDTLGGTYLNEIGFLQQQSNITSGLNNAQQGNFQRGNKTLGEFNEIMANADDDLRTLAKLVESQGMTPLKIVIKTNMIQYQPSTTVESEVNGSRVRVNPVDIREAVTTFKLADGLLSRSAILDLPTARAVFELITQSPILQQRYGNSLPELVSYIFSSMNFDISQFDSQQAGGQPQVPQTQGDNSAS